MRFDEELEKGCDGGSQFDFFFFKQKTAYEIMPSLVGSEMCIRDSLSKTEYRGREATDFKEDDIELFTDIANKVKQTNSSVSYTHLTLPTICSV
ncbi:hypothetical protein CDFC105_63929 [Clostridioides difficile]|nr:hypothetical protein CDFC105_63929 [Clostridioides difficile]